MDPNVRYLLPPFHIEPGRSPSPPLTRFVLGISAFYHDSAACLLADGEVVAAAQEERFTRLKGDPAFPANAIRFCLRHGGVDAGALAAVAFYEKPLLKLDRLLESYLALAPRGFQSFLKAAPLWLDERVHIDASIRRELGGFSGDLLYAEHHESHAASAFFPSPFENAAILTIDGVGEWATAAIGMGRGAELSLLHELHYPDSLGLLYSAFTYHAGFRVNSGEYKLMGLAPYGEPRYVDRILGEVVALRDDGSFTLDQRFFDYIGGLTMTSRHFSERFDGPPRAPESPLTQREMDYARSVQVVCEEIVLRMAATAHRETGADTLCMAGGVALNAVANGRLMREGPFRKLWIQPAAGDAGGALGAAMLAWHRRFRGPRPPTRTRDAMHGSLLGPAFAPSDAEAELLAAGARVHRLDDSELLPRVAALLAERRVVGWFDGPMEYGPRSLGSRSILADPRDPAMQRTLNLKIKFRESFRPFAPSVLAERAEEIFELCGESPYMLLVAPLREEHRLALPAVTHRDSSARVQTVSHDTSPRFHELLRAFEALTGCPVLVNTSFNVRGEPIVCTPTDAYRCFLRTRMDALVVHPFLMLRSEQPAPELDDDFPWQQTFPLD